MKLFTKEIDIALFAQYKKKEEYALKGEEMPADEELVICKIFNPYGRGVWYIIDCDPNDPDYLWGIVNSFDIEMGSFSRNDLVSIKVPPFRLGLERDMSWTPKPVTEVYKGLLEGNHYELGGPLSDGKVNIDTDMGGFYLVRVWDDKGLETLSRHKRKEDAEEIKTMMDNGASYSEVKAKIKEQSDNGHISHILGYKSKLLADGGEIEDKYADGGMITSAMDETSTVDVNGHKYNVKVKYSKQHNSTTINIEDKGPLPYGWTIQGMPIEVIQQMYKMLGKIVGNKGGDTDGLEKGDLVKMFEDEPLLIINGINPHENDKTTYDLISTDGTISRKNISPNKFTKVANRKLAKGGQLKRKMKYANGGPLDMFIPENELLNKLEGQSLVIYVHGSDDPLYDTIISASISPEYFEHRTLNLKMKAGNTEQIPLDKIRAFFNKETITVKDDQGDKYDIELSKFIEGIYKPLRSVKITYDNGETMTTSMASHLSDKEIKDYYAIDSSWDLGSYPKEEWHKITKVEILK